MQKNILKFFMTFSLSFLTNICVAQGFSVGNNSVETTWTDLQNKNLSQLKNYQPNDELSQGWLALALLSKQKNKNSDELIDALQVWRSQYPGHPGNALFPDNEVLLKLNDTATPKHYALILPLHGVLSKEGQAVRDGFLSLYYKSHSDKTVSFYDTSEQSVAALYKKALEEGADFIIGPLTREQVKSLASINNFNVPTLALNYTDTSNTHENLYQFGLSPQDEAKQLAEKARDSGSSRALVIVSQNEWGERVNSTLLNHWKSLGGSIEEVLFIKPNTNVVDAIAKLLHISSSKTDEKLNQNDFAKHIQERARKDFDVIFILTSAQTARQVVPALRYYYVNHIPMYATSSIFTGSKDKDLNGVTFCDSPWALRNAKGNRLSAVGKDAYLLSLELQKLSILQNFPIQGATGGLTLSNHHQIYRQLSWATMHNGHPQ